MRKQLVDIFDRVFKGAKTRLVMQYLLDSGFSVDYTGGYICNAVESFKTFANNIGLKEGNRVALIAPLSPKVVVIGLAAACFGVTLVPLDNTLPAQELDRLIEFSDVRLLLTVTDILKKLDKSKLQDIGVLNFETGLDDFGIFDSSGVVIKKEATLDPLLDVVAIIYSSGTTSSMKGIMYTYDSLLKMLEYTKDFTELSDKTTYLDVMPYNHIAGYASAMSALLNGCQLGFVENLDATKLAAAFQWYNPTHFGMVSRVYESIEVKIRNAIHEQGEFTEGVVLKLLKLSGFMRRKLGINIGKFIFKGITSKVFGKNIKILMSGATPFKESTQKFFLDLGLTSVNIYALTETGLPVTSTGYFDRYPVGTVGRIDRFNCLVFIHKPDENGVGEIYVKTPLIMKGYFRDPELTAAAFSRTDYFKTGDLGYIDKEGYLYISGRSKESIVLHTGKKLAPTDVENIYKSEFPDVELAVAGVPRKDGSGYDEIHMFIENSINFGKTTVAEITANMQRFSNKLESIFKLAAVHVIPKIPVTSVGKVKRFLLKDMIDDSTVPEGNIKEVIKGSKEEIDIILEVIACHANGQVITRNSNLKNDLGFDSLEILQLSCDIEERLGLVLGDLSKANTVQDWIDIVRYGTISAVVSEGSLEQKRTWLHSIVLSILLWLVRVFWRVEVKGIENIPVEGNYILCANHQSNLDSLSVLSALQRYNKLNFAKLCCLVKESYKNFKFGLAMVGGIPIERTGDTIPAMKLALRKLKEGYIMLIHPEGTRSKDGQLQSFKGGAAKLALEAGVNIVPVYVRGTFEIFPSSSRFPKLFNLRKRQLITILFGEPLLSQDNIVESLTERLELSIQQLSVKDF